MREERDTKEETRGEEGEGSRETGKIEDGRGEERLEEGKQGR